MKCILIDDNEHAIETLRSLIEIFCPKLEIVGSSQTIKDGVVLIHEQQPNLVFLDVEILNEKGFDLLQYFPERNFQVIFTTAHEKYALQAIKNGCFDYLLKPIEPNELVKTIHNLENSNQEKLDVKGESETKRIALIINNEYVFVKEDEIMYLKADGKYTDIFTKNGINYKSTKNIGEIEQLLSSNFFKCHKACIINMKYVTKFIKEYLIIVLNDSIEIELATRRKEDFLKFFNKI